MKSAPTTWLWLALIALQPLWFGVLAPWRPPGAALSALVMTLPLLLPAPWVLGGRMRGLVVGGLLLLGYFCVAVMELWAHPAPGVKIAATVQLVLITAYFHALLVIRRRERADRAAY